jgi:cell division protein FtsL
MQSVNFTTLSWVIFLWFVVVLSALAVVFVTNESRSNLNQLEILRREKAQLHVDWGRFLLEQSAWSSFGRIERIATDKLGMSVPSGEQLIMVQQ